MASGSDSFSKTEISTAKMLIRLPACLVPAAAGPSYPTTRRGGAKWPFSTIPFKHGDDVN